MDEQHTDNSKRIFLAMLAGLAVLLLFVVYQGVAALAWLSCGMAHLCGCHGHVCVCVSWAISSR